MKDFEKIEKAIGYIRENFRNQPDLDEVARQVYLSPFHFQRLFKDWAGVTPKKFLQYTSLEHAKDLLRKHHTLADVSFDSGLSGTGRLHDLFISIEGMTPGEYKNEGANLHINYSFAETPFGDVLIASTLKGICHISFGEDRHQEFEILKKLFSKAEFSQKTDISQQHALQIFQADWKDLPEIKLHLKATPFQIKVWEALLKIPFGQVDSYGQVAKSVGLPNASRAIGTAIGSNPVAFLIPCHRVIRATGNVGEYHWGTDRKTAMIGWEGAKVLGE
jgi:AraC family transcriptional regulator, regulatory protein of adaptative response / methylated-DNA-[protein]-cysteine methyltransferase